MRTLIMKFGGTTVGTVDALTQVLSIVLYEHQRWDRLLVVASALEGVTDMLYQAAQLAQWNNQRGYRRIAATLRMRHLALVEQLPLERSERTALEADIDRLLFEMLEECHAVASSTHTDDLAPDVGDRIAAVGERLAARIIAGLLRKNDLRAVAVDSTDIIITDATFGSATPLMEPTCERVQLHIKPMLERNIIPVITGYIGATPDGRVTTLGRGGSDYTASVLSVCLPAEQVWLWSNVDGMMSADPDHVPEARIVPELSYEEVAELAYFGARILHPRMIRPMQQGQIPLRIRNVFKPQEAGTRIQEPQVSNGARIKAVTSIAAIGLTTQRSGPLAAVAAVIDQVLTERLGNPSDVMLSSQSSTRSFLCFIVPTTAGPDAIDDALQDDIRARLGEMVQEGAWDVARVSVVTAIGEHLGESPALLAHILGAVADVALLGVVKGPSENSLSLIVGADDALRTVAYVHALTQQIPDAL